MINIYIGIEDKNIEKLLKIFLEKFYYIKVSDLKLIDEDEVSHNSIAISDEKIDFPGYQVTVGESEEPFSYTSDKHFLISNESIELVYFLMAIDDIFTSIKAESGELVDDTFVKWPKEYVSLLEGASCRLFIKVGSIRFKPITLQEYNGSDDLYLRRNDNFVVFAKLEQHFLNIIESKESSFKDQVVSAQHMAKMIGINSDAIKAVDKLVDNIFDSLKKIKEVKGIFNGLKSEDNQYFEMIKLTMYTGTMLCKSDSSLNNENIFKKVITAALFMDMTLDEDKERMILNLADIATEGLSRNQRNRIRNHPIDGSNTLNQYLEFGRDELTLMERHHEKPDGSGFPKSLRSDSMSVLQNLFITAYHFAHYMCFEALSDNFSEESLKVVIEKMTEEGFAAGPCLKYFSALSRFAQD